MDKHIVEFLTNRFDPDPRVYKEARYMVEKGCDVTILCWDREPRPDSPLEETIDGIHVVRFPIAAQLGSGKKQLPAYFAYIRACRGWLKENPCDAYHCNDMDGAIAWYFARRSAKTPMVFDMHEYYEDVGTGHEIRRRFWRAMTIFMIRRSRYALYVNDYYLEKPYRSVHDKLLPLKNYPDPDILKALPKTRSDVFRIGYHGGVRSQIQEFTTLFEAVRGMADVRVDIYGDGPDLAKLRELEKQYGNVHIHGKFNGVEELTGLYADADIVYAGYRPDSLTREHAEVVKFFECIYTGTPVILTAAYTGMAKLIEQYGFGLTCDTLDVNAVRAAVLKLKDDHAFWEACAKHELDEAWRYNSKQAVRVLDQAHSL